MRRFLVFIMMLALAVPGPAQDRKEGRRARRMAAASEDSVNVGYGYVKRKNLTTSVSKVTVDHDQLGSYANIGEYLRGRVPGLIVTKYGGSYKYSIRGITSINASTDPLFVVDGCVVTDIDHLNPHDVKSVEVLKDASTSIYGSRGACRVILITTRRPGD